MKALSLKFVATQIKLINQLYYSRLTDPVFLKQEESKGIKLRTVTSAALWTILDGGLLTYILLDCWIVGWVDGLLLGRSWLGRLGCWVVVGLLLGCCCWVGGVGGVWGWGLGVGGSSVTVLLTLSALQLHT